MIGIRDITNQLGRIFLVVLQISRRRGSRSLCHDSAQIIPLEVRRAQIAYLSVRLERKMLNK